MNTMHQAHHSPALRLKWLEALSPPLRRQTYPRNYLIGVGLGGYAGSDRWGRHCHWQLRHPADQSVRGTID
jgi:hypothetical protein